MIAGGAAPPRRFRRSASARYGSLVALALFDGAAAWRLLAGDIGPGLFFTSALALLSAIGVAGAWGDAIILDARGARIENRFWQAMGRAPRAVAWADVAALREHFRLSAVGERRLAAIFVVPARGRTLPLDALDDLDAACALARAHLDAARRDAAAERPETQ